MKKEDIELKLLANLPIQIENLGKYKSLTLKQLAEIGEEEYSNILGHLLFDKDDIPRSDSEEDSLTTLNMISMISYLDSNFKLTIERGIELFFREKVSLYFTEDEAFFYFGEFNEFRHFTEELWELFCLVLRVDNHIPKQKKFEDEYEFLTEEARLAYQEMQRRKANAFKPKSKVNLHSRISSVANKSNGLNIQEIWDLNIYQFHDQYNRLDHIGHYENTMLGIYTGNIDSKGIKLDDIHWANIILNK